jgi:integrase
MPVYKDEARDEWFVQTAYHNSDGKRVRTTKRGFAMKREAQAWEADFLAQHEGSLDMTFARFYELYEKDCGPRLKLNTRLTKEALVKSKIMPFFGSMQMSQISPSDVIRWQNGLLAAGTDSGEPYSRCYLRTISNQLSAIFNHAVRFYGLRDNPMSAIHRMGQARGAEMKFWTKDEYLAFAEQIQDKPISFTAFEILYWTGIREGELLALTPADIDLTRHTLRVTKSYQRLQGKDVITSPKTPRSVRTIALPPLPLRRDRRVRGLHRHGPRRPPLPHHQELPLPRDAARQRGGGRQADPHPRPAPLPRVAAHRDGLLGARHSRAHGPRERRHHLPLRPPLPRQAAQDGRRARGPEGREMIAPNLDRSGRRRSVHVTFRMSPEEASELDAFVDASGLTKQDYITARLLERDVRVVPSSRLRQGLSRQMDAVYRELRRIANAGQASPELVEVTELLAREFGGLGQERRPSDSEKDFEAFEGMGRE